ncbi:hypothetical protein HispidOSU_022018 [Sigmodon hispidus]
MGCATPARPSWQVCVPRLHGKDSHSWAGDCREQLLHQDVSVQECVLRATYGVNLQEHVGISVPDSTFHGTANQEKLQQPAGRGSQTRHQDSQGTLTISCF